MKRLRCSLIAIVFLISCGEKQPQVDRINEDGVEIVLNHGEPYRIPGEPSTLSLERETTLDSEAPGLLKAGLTDIRQFGADSRGHIYVLQRPRKDSPFIFKFDAAGRLLGSFGRFGQGPGEIERSSFFGVNSRDELFCLDGQGRKILFYSSSGEVLNEIRLPSHLFGAVPLDDGSFFYSESQVSPDAGFEEMTFSVLDRRYAKIKDLHRFRFPAEFPGAGKKANAFLFSPTGTLTAGRIFLGMVGTEYEILAFDLRGTALWTLRKSYSPVEVKAAYRDEALAGLPQGSPMAGNLEFPRQRPAYQYLFADESGRLFAMTSEKDESSGQYICDIFDASGAFICRAPLGYYDRFRQMWEGVSLDVVAKNGRFYVLHEKADGYKELIVYKAHWGRDNG